MINVDQTSICVIKLFQYVHFNKKNQNLDFYMVTFVTMVAKSDLTVFMNGNNQGLFIGPF